MEADPSLLSFNVALGVLLVDILLSGDNAIVIALVCRSLSLEHRTKALWLGVAGAFLARLVLTSCASMAMNLPLIKLLGGLLLLKISIDLIVDNANPQAVPPEQRHSSAGDLFTAAKTIVLADIVMSLDNVLALSAITQNNFPMLVAGLLLSIPILMFGSLYISRLLDVFPYLLWAGGAILGAVSGSLIIEDPIFGGAFSNASSMAGVVVPVLAAGFVVQIGRVISVNAQRMQSVPRPPSIFAILFPGASNASAARATAVAREQATARAQENGSPPGVTAHPNKAVAAQVSGASAVAPGTAPSTASSGGDHRVVIALGLFMAVAGGLLYYMLNVLEAPMPDRFIRYTCKQPALSISYRPGSTEIHFASAQESITTSVIEGRIAWEDYKEAGDRLSMELPVKILSADSRRLIVSGGGFDNTSCEAAVQP